MIKSKGVLGFWGFGVLVEEENADGAGGLAR